MLQACAEQRGKRQDLGEGCFPPTSSRTVDAIPSRVVLSDPVAFTVERQDASPRHPYAGCIEPRPSLLKGDCGGRSGGRFREGGEGAEGAGSKRGSHFHRPPTASSAGHLKRHDLKRRGGPRSGVCFPGCDARAKGVAGRAGRGGRGCSPPVPIAHGRRCCTLGASPAAPRSPATP